MRLVYVVTACLALASLSVGQESKADVFGGYSYLNIDTNGLSSRQSANGWEASVSGNFNKWFAVEGDVSGYYKSYSINLSALNLGTAVVKVTDYAFAGGPRINLKPIFVHALFGGDHLTGSAQGFSRSQDGLAGLVGGGVQWRVSGPWSVRASGDYVFTRHNIFGGPSVTQNNFRAGIGIVYSFGARRAREVGYVPEARPAEHPQRIPAPQPSPPGPAAPAPRFSGQGMTIGVLGVVVAAGRNSGAEITDESPNGVAALAGLHPGDVINTVDGKSVKTPMELAAELAGRHAGDKVRLGYLVRRLWQAETAIVLP